MYLMNTSKSFRLLKIKFYASTRVPLKNIFLTLTVLMLKMKLKMMFDA